MRTADASTDARIIAELGITPGPLVSVPLVADFPGADEADARPYGALMAMRSRGARPFTDDDERILALVAPRVAAALHEIATSE